MSRPWGAHAAPASRRAIATCASSSDGRGEPRIAAKNASSARSAPAGSRTTSQCQAASRSPGASARRAPLVGENLKREAGVELGIVQAAAHESTVLIMLDQAGDRDCGERRAARDAAYRRRAAPTVAARAGPRPDAADRRRSGCGRERTTRPRRSGRAPAERRRHVHRHGRNCRRSRPAPRRWRGCVRRLCRPPDRARGSGERTARRPGTRHRPSVRPAAGRRRGSRRGCAKRVSPFLPPRAGAQRPGDQAVRRRPTCRARRCPSARRRRRRSSRTGCGPSRRCTSRR